MYICLEGIDGSGKSTQVEMLINWLRKCGIEVFRVFEPTDSPAGRLIRNMLRNPNATNENFQKTLALLFAADRIILMDKITEAISRCEGKDSFEDIDFLTKIRERYLDLAEKEDFMVVNAKNGLNKVHDDIKRVMARKLGMCI